MSKYKIIIIHGNIKWGNGFTLTLTHDRLYGAFGLVDAAGNAMARMNVSSNAIVLYTPTNTPLCGENTANGNLTVIGLFPIN